MACAFGLAVLLTHSEIATTSLADFLTLRLELGNFAIFLLLLVLWHMIFSSFHLYQSRRIATRWHTEPMDIVKAVTMGTLALGGLGLLFQIEIYCRYQSPCTGDCAQD
jgi:hypothetical protein